MPLASPSSLTSNTLATFLDHVPISTNNAEKWKPKQMGSNSGGDYWALARALSAPLGTKRWILHYLFLSTGTEVWGQKTVAAFCLHATETSASRCRWSFLSLTRGMNVLDCTWTFISVVAFFYSMFFIHYMIFYVITDALSPKCLCYIICGTSVKLFPTVTDHVGPVACKQYLILWQQCFVLLIDTTK